MQDPRYLGYIALLNRHGRRIFGLTALAVVLTYIWCMMPFLQRYTAEATIVLPLTKSGAELRRVLGNINLPAGGASSAIGQMQEDYPIITLLESRQMAQYIVDRHPEVKAKLDKRNRNDLQKISEKLVKKHLKLNDDDQGALRIGFEWPDRQVAANVANSYAEGLRDILTRLNGGNAQAIGDFIQLRLEGAEGEPGLLQGIDALEQEIANYKKSAGILAVEPEADAYIEATATLEELYAEAQVDAVASRRKLEAIEGREGASRGSVRHMDPASDLFELEEIQGSDLIADVADLDYYPAAPPASALADPAVAALRRQLVAAESERAQKLILFTPDHPEIVKLTRDIFQLKHQLANELVFYSDALGVNVLIDTIALEARRDAAQQLMDDLDKQITEFPEKERKLIALERRRELLVKVYVLMAQELEQSRLAEAAVDTSFTILDPAIPPSKASSPRRIRVAAAVAIFAFLGLLLHAAWVEGRGATHTE